MFIPFQNSRGSSSSLHPVVKSKTVASILSNMGASAFIWFLLVFLVTSFFSSPAWAQSEGAKIVTIMGQAEILAAGVWREARVDEYLKPGESVRLVGGGVVRVSAEDDKISITLDEETVLRYDGAVAPDDRPWKDGVPFVRTGRGEPTPAVEVPQFTVPYGRTDVSVTPGQPLRVVAPLIAAAVRGTRFTLAVALDGSSSLSAVEGEVLAISRTGAAQIMGAGGGMSLTADEFGQFLSQAGVSPPGGDWRNLDLRSLET
jgi:hypothetical protein